MSKTPTQTKDTQQKEKASLSHKILTVVGTVICLILLPLLIANITLIVRSYTNPDVVPSVGGITPMIVLTDSMYPNIHSGDLIFCRSVAVEDVQVGDVISFFDPAGNGTSVVTHRVTEVTTEDGMLAWRTKGDANNIADAALVPADNLVGVYSSRIAGLGSVAMFMQTTAGLIVCVVFPLIAIVGYDLIRRRNYEKKQQADTDALLAELQALKAEKAAKEDGGTTT